jgi:hypothetical protein
VNKRLKYIVDFIEAEFIFGAMKKAAVKIYDFLNSLPTGRCLSQISTIRKS